MRLTIACYGVQQAHAALSEVIWPVIKDSVASGRRMVVEVRRDRRSNAANARLHAILARIARHKVWSGRHWPASTWKRLLLVAWARECGEDDVEILPALDGDGVDLVWRRSSEMSSDEFAEFLDYVEAWAAQEGLETEQATRERDERKGLDHG